MTWCSCLYFIYLHTTTLFQHNVIQGGWGCGQMIIFIVNFLRQIIGIQ